MLGEKCYKFFSFYKINFLYLKKNCKIKKKTIFQIIFELHNVGYYLTLNSMFLTGDTGDVVDHSF